MNFTVNYNLDDNWRDISKWCKQIAPLWYEDAPHAWTLDLTSCDYFGPFASSVVYAAWINAKQLGQEPDIVLPTEPDSLRAYCAFSNLNHLLHNGRQADPHFPGNETVPVQQFFGDAYDQTERVLRLVRRHQSLSDDDEVTLSAAIHEVCQNIADHAESPIGGVSSARFFSSSRQIRVAIVDFGVTIARSLSRQHSVPNDVVALEMVSRGRITSGSRKHNMGLGISNLIGFVRQLEGSLSLLSGSAVARIRNADQQIQFDELDWRFPGTGVFFTLTVGEPDDADNEYE